MYKLKTITKSDIRFLGIKIHEKIEEKIELFAHPFIDDYEEQELLAENCLITEKILGIPYIKVEGCDDPKFIFKPEGLRQN